MPILSEYYTPQKPIQEDITELSDPSLQLEVERDKINALVMNLVLKFTALYFESNSPKIKDIQRIVSRKLQKETYSLVSEIDAMRCLAHTRSTAALVKEIIFNQRFKAKEAYLAVDWGSGSGILTLASVIAGRRSEVELALTYGIEQEPQTVQHSRIALDLALEEGNEWGGIIHGDVFENDLWEHLDIGLSQWISETFSRTTREFRVENEQVVYKQRNIPKDHPSAAVSKWLQSSKTIVDPFDQLLATTLSRIPDFEQSVRNRETAMFPDPINGHLVTSNENGTSLKLDTADTEEHLPLSAIGSEFKEYEALETGYRWR